MNHEHANGAPPLPSSATGPPSVRRERCRVALCISSLGPGGAERVSSALASYWARGGRDVSIVTVGSLDRDAYPLDPGVRRVALDLLRPSRNLAEAFVQGSRRVLALRRALDRLRPDVVVSFMRATNVLSLIAASGTGVPVFVCERTDPRHETTRAVWAALRRLLYPRAAGVVVQTESVGDWARSFCQRVHVIPNFVERPALTAMPGKDHGPRRLIAMGRLNPEKGFDRLIEAFARVADTQPDWSLAILGEGRERARLEALVRTLHVEHRVSMPGRAVDPIPHLAAAHLFALPSRREGFPNALLEAMACGLPAIAFDCPSGPSAIIEHEKNGLLLPAGDVASLADALHRLMASAADRASMGQNAREIATRLAPDRILATWDALLKSGDRESPPV